MEAKMVNLIVIVIGIFVVVMAVANQDWFFERSRARFTVQFFGRQGARIVYGITGVVIVLMGIFTPMG
jgi:hypothetical protein